MTTNQERWLTVKEYADLMRVSEETVRRWIRAGHLKAEQHGKRGQYRILLQSAA